MEWRLRDGKSRLRRIKAWPVLTTAAIKAIVAGCNLAFVPEPFLTLSNMNVLSPDGRCYSFDHRGNGYARSEGFGVVIVKRVSDAIRDGDTIRAVIRSTGSNQDGRTPGVSEPSKDAQERLIKETYAKAGLDMRTTRFFEAHGTGTAVGDPIESGAIGAAFRKYRSPSEPLYMYVLLSA
jgi:acyl transferase domain-containing protein